MDAAGNEAVMELVIIVREKVSVEITFDYGYDNILEVVVIEKGGRVNKLDIPPRTGFILVGWFYEEDLFEFDTLVTEDITLIARWNKEEYSLVLPKEVTSDQFNNDIILYDTLVTLEVHYTEGLVVEEFKVNDIDVTYDLIDEKFYSFIMEADTVVTVVIGPKLASANIRNKGPHTQGVSGNVNEYVNIDFETSSLNIDVIYHKRDAITHSIFNNSNNEIRLYPGLGNGSALEIILEEGYEIEKLIITTGNNAGFSINSDGNYTNANSEIEITLFDASRSVLIQNIADVATGSRVDLRNIKIYYNDRPNDIVDVTPPVIHFKKTSNDFIFELSDYWPSEDILSWVEVSDNVDAPEDLTVQLDDDLLPFKDGQFIRPEGDETNFKWYFTLTYTVTDTSGNVAKLTFVVTIYDDINTLLLRLDYSGFDGYYTSINHSTDSESVIHNMANLLRQTVTYQQYAAARDLYVPYDDSYQVVLYDFEPNPSYRLIPFAWGNGGYVMTDGGIEVKLEREHVWPASNMMIRPTTLDTRTKQYVGYELNLDGSFKYRPTNEHRGHHSDLHNLWLSIGAGNGSHANSYFGEVLGPSKAYYSANSLFYPGDEYKGDIARILFYMTLMYPHLTLVNQGDENAITNNIYYGYLDILLKWNDEDPVSEYEIARNNLIFARQGNRNPFVDFYDQGFAEKVFLFGDPEVPDNSILYIH